MDDEIDIYWHHHLSNHNPSVKEGNIFHITTMTFVQKLTIYYFLKQQLVLGHYDIATLI